MVRIVSEQAPAKINLCLHVIGKRADGYHDLDSIMLPVTLYDQLAIELRDGRGRRVTLICNRTDIPLDERNLAVRAAHAFMDEFSVDADVTIDLRKAIPPGAGLGGGSSDAAAVLRAMATLTRRNDPVRLAALALSLGADVPFFLSARPSRARGVGEILTELSGFPRLDLVIAIPPVEVSTAAVFRALEPENWSGPIDSGALDRMTGGRVAGADLINDLEAAAIALFPVIGELKLKLQVLGAVAAAMTGSGGAVFGVFDNPADAAMAADQLRSEAPEVAVAVVHSIAAGASA
jgi:4-diphosphocytidyl-2-C-methyl-D-erythritol kinase